MQERLLMDNAVRFNTTNPDAWPATDEIMPYSGGTESPVLEEDKQALDEFCDEWLERVKEELGET